jgi:putative membrane protein
MMNRLGFRGARHFIGGGISGPNPLMFVVMGINIIIVIALIIIAVKLFKKYANHNRKALCILDEKFVNGEITEEEYLKRKTILKQK